MKRLSAVALTLAGAGCVALTLISTGCRCSLSGETYLAKDGKTDYTIVCQDDEPTLEATRQTASGELKLYLEQMTGATFPVVKESEFNGKTPALYVGNTKYALKNGVDPRSMAVEAWMYKTVGDGMIFAGGKNNGALLAVCEFLERELGCHWFTFESTHVPKRPVLALQPWSRSGAPAFSHREIYISYWGLSGEMNLAYQKFTKRNRANVFDSPLRVSHQTGTCHTFYEYVSWKEHFAAHPEYFSMNAKGERFHGDSMHSGGQLCLSNPEVADVILNRLRGFIKKDRATLPPGKWPTVYDISQNDNSGFICFCPACKEITKREGSEAALTLTCFNKVAREIAKEYPDVIIQTFAYVSTERAPKTLRPEKNILLRWCDLYTRSDCYRPITSPFNASRKEQLDGWKAVGANIALWDYWNMGILDGPYFKPPRVETMVDAIAGDVRYYREAGVKTFFTEMETHIHANPQNFVDLQIWLGYQLINDPDQDEEALIRTYMEKHYGPTAAPMTAFLTDLRQAVAGEKKALIYISNPVREYQTAEFFGRVLGYLRQAQALAPQGSEYRRRVNKELITPLAVILSNPQWTPARNPPLRRPELAAEYGTLSKEQITAYCSPEKQKEFLKLLAGEMETLTYELPTPPQFAHIPKARIQKFGYPVFNSVTNDPDSVVGRAMCSPDNKPALHDMTKPGPGSLLPTWFGVYDSQTKKSIQFRTPEVPKDEKYHWYKLGTFEFGRNTIVWGWFWIISADMRNAWTNADGLAGYNTWEVWVSAKFSGPAYVSGSSKPNRVWMDQVVLIKPE
ncbi:MAG: DUF4838 domain-containing protein [Kiritimatiellae bacterium]|nr:DUF4838 domain-containing protein [Kiritimatiellia bacterium]